MDSDGGYVIYYCGRGQSGQKRDQIKETDQPRSRLVIPLSKATRLHMYTMFVCIYALTILCFINDYVYDSDSEKLLK